MRRFTRSCLDLSLHLGASGCFIACTPLPEGDSSNSRTQTEGTTRGTEETSGDEDCPDELDDLCPMTPSCLDAPVYFRDDVQPELVALCGDPSCHGASDPAVGLAFDSANAYELLLASSGFSTLPRVVPSQPFNSYLYHKLHGSYVCEDIVGEAGSMTEIMPPAYEWDASYTEDDPFFPQHQRHLALRDTVTRWICCGALEQPEDVP